jgi:hypothetical protein
LQIAIEGAHRVARETLKQSQKRMKRDYDVKVRVKELKLGDLVYPTYWSPSGCPVFPGLPNISSAGSPISLPNIIILGVYPVLLDVKVRVKELKLGS